MKSLFKGMLLATAMRLCTASTIHAAGKVSKASSSCFPSANFTMPSTVPSSITDWWCDRNTEYAFMGFSYDVSMCQSLTTLRREFKDIKDTFSGRYVRLYGACDRSGFYNDVVDAAWNAGVGVHSLIWFGWDPDAPDIWIPRRDALFSILQSNPKAKFVTRTVQFGSEPLYDWAIDPPDLAAQVKAAKTKLAPLGIPITVSEMAWGYQVRKDYGSMQVLAAIDFIDAHILPFYHNKASTASNSWFLIQDDINWFSANATGKKVYFSQTGWPSTTYPGLESESPNAVANVQNEQDYYTLLDSKCSYFKTLAGGGIGWFAHMYSAAQDPAWGVYALDGKLKFPFKPRTSC